MSTKTHIRKINEIFAKLEFIKSRQLDHIDSLDLNIAPSMYFYYKEAARTFDLFTSFPYDIPSSIVTLAMIARLPDLKVLLITKQITADSTRKDIIALKKKLKYSDYPSSNDITLDNTLEQDDVVLILLIDKNNNFDTTHYFGYKDTDEDIINFCKTSHPSYTVHHISRG